MQEQDFYSYMYGNSAPTFDELADGVELSDEDAVTRAFAAYVGENPPPSDIAESLLEEKFYLSGDDGDEGKDTLLRYDNELVEFDEDISAEDLRTYLEDFCEKIGVENGVGGNSVSVDVTARDDGRGGVIYDVYVAVGGPQIKGVT